MLKLTTLSIALLVASSLSFASTNLVTSNDNDREALSITIYNESLALVNETRTIPLKVGINNVELKGVSAQIRAETALMTSLSNSPFRIIEQNFDYDLLSPQALLNKAVGKEIEIIKKHPTTGEEPRESAILLSNNGQPVLQFKDRIEIGNFNNFAFKSIPEDLRDRPTLSVLLNSDKANNNKIQLTYLTGGFSWKADYTATLSQDEKLMDLSGLITLKNQSGTTFNNAKLQLIAGDVNQTRTRNFDIYSVSISYEHSLDFDTKKSPKIQKESFGDYRLYKIPFTTNLKNNQTKQVALLSTQNVPIKKEYRFQTSYNYTTKDGENLKASVLYRINNNKENQLGMPLPKGIFRMYKNDSTGNALLLGTETIRVAEKVHQYTYKVVFNNAKDEEVTVNYSSVIPNHSTWQLVNTSHPSTTKSAKTAEWMVKIPAKEKVTLIYTLQTANQ